MERRWTKMQRLAERMRQGNGTLISTDFLAFINYLANNEEATATLEALLQRERPAFLELPAFLASNCSAFFGQHGGFDFLNTEEERVAFSYATLLALRSIKRDELVNTLLAIGTKIVEISREGGRDSCSNAGLGAISCTC